MATQKKKSSTKQKKAAPKTNTAQRESTRRALTDDAKQARMEVWATKLGVSKDVVHQLNDKYGSYSYTMMQRAMAEPAKLMSDVGEGYKGSKGAIEYLAKGTLTSEQIAKVTGEKSTLKVDNNLAQAKLDAARREAAAIEAGKRNNPVAQAKKEADKKNDKLVARVDNKKQQNTGDNKARAAIRDETARKEQERVRAEKAAQEKAAKEKAAQEKAAKEKAAQEKAAQEKALAAKERVAKEKAEQEAKVKGNAGDKAAAGKAPYKEGQAPAEVAEKAEEMTLDDYMQHYKKEDKPLTGQKLVDAAWNDFGKSEGLRRFVYQDSKGHPTIGNGHLIIRKDQIYSKAAVEQYKEKFKKLQLMKGDRALTADEKGKLYDNLIANMRKTGKIGDTSQYGCLSTAGMKQTFSGDFAVNYDKAKRVFPDIDKYPLKTQLSVVHAYYAGAGNIITNTITGNTGKYAAATRKKLAPYKGVDKSDPEAVQNMILAVRDTKHTSRNELKTGKEGLDSIQYAQQSWVQQQIELEQQQKRVFTAPWQVAQAQANAGNGNG